MKQALQTRRFPPVGTARPVSRPPPVLGWNTRDSLASMRAGYAPVLDNWIPRPSKLEMRKGAADHKTGFGASTDVETLMAYRPASGSGKLFAAAGTGIYDATSAGAVGAAVSSITNARLQHVNFATSAGQFLCMVNGADDYRHYNGTTWTTIATFTFGAGTLATNTLIGIMAHQSRLYFIAENSLRFYYMETAGTISGTVKEFNLDQVFSMGGYLMAMGSWSQDAGDGPEDRAVFVSSEGQIAVYSGTDPGDTTKWALVGTYFVGRPVGRRCLVKWAGDLVLLTERGLFPLSRALVQANVDKSIALSDPIEPTIAANAASLISTFGWQMVLHTAENLLLIAVPSTPAYLYGMELQSKGWFRVKAWDALCLEVFDGALYYGTTSKVVRAFYGTDDFDSQIEAEMMGAYDYFGMRGQTKLLRLIRATFSAGAGFSLLLGGNTDFGIQVPYAVTETVPAVDTALWDTATWDNSYWTADAIIFADWRTIATKPGFNFSLYLKVASSNTTPSLLAIDYIFDKGGLL